MEEEIQKIHKPETLEELERKLGRKEKQARFAKDKGMKTSYGLLLTEIALIKFKIKKFQTGGDVRI